MVGPLCLKRISALQIVSSWTKSATGKACQRRFLSWGKEKGYKKLLVGEFEVRLDMAPMHEALEGNAALNIYFFN